MPSQQLHHISKPMNDHKDSLIRIGLFADVQYAEADDSHSFRGNPRYYRQALVSARTAVEEFTSPGGKQVDAILNLGDLLDAKVAKGENPEACWKNLQEQVLGPAHKSGIPFYHVVGNHELEVVGGSREEWQRRLQKTGADGAAADLITTEPDGDQVAYYSVVLPTTRSSTKRGRDAGEQEEGALRLICLDTYDISWQRLNHKSVGEGAVHDDPKFTIAQHLLRKHNPHNETGNFKSPDGLTGVARRFVRMGGAVGDVQLSWLRQELTAARAANQVVVVASHQPIHPDSVAQADLPASLCWNYDVLQNLLQHEFRDVVAMSLSGHAHRDGACRDGVNYRVLEATLEHREATFGILEYCPPGAQTPTSRPSMRIRGFGALPSGEYPLDHLACHGRTTRS